MDPLMATLLELNTRAMPSMGIALENVAISCLVHAPCARRHPMNA